MGIAAGIQLRRQALNQTLDAIQLSGRLAGQGLPQRPINTDRDIRSGFVEARVPLGDVVEAQLALRTDHYSDFGTTTNPKVGLAWTPTDTLLFRATWGTSFRPPAFRELFDPEVVSLRFHDPDPWRCSVTGDVFDCNGSSVPATTVGNPALEPEEGESWLLGFSWSPPGIEGLTVTADVWSIEHTDRIIRSEVNAALLVERLPPDQNPFVIRAEPTPEDIALGIPGPIIGLLDTYINADKLETQGLDVDVQYLTAIGDGEFFARLSYTYVDQYELGLSFEGISLVEDLAGGYGVLGPVPRQRANVSAGWEGDRHSLAGTLHYAGDYESGTVLHVDGAPTGDPFRVGSWWALDLQYAYRFESLDGATLRIGCRNCTDEDPPVYNDTINGVNIHDGRGAMIYARWSQSF